MFDHPPLPGWDRMSDSQKKSATARWVADSTVLRGRVNIQLLPGETLRTRDWKPVSREDACAAEKTGLPDPERPGGLFRQHARRGDFSRPGTYRVKLLLDDSGTAGSNKLREILATKGHSPSEIDSLLNSRFARPAVFASSNELLLEVVP